MEKQFSNGTFEQYLSPKAPKVGFVLVCVMMLLYSSLPPTNFAVAGPWPVFDIKDYESVAANWAGDCFPQETVRRAKYIGCPGNKVGHHAVIVYMTGAINIMKFDIRDERISDELVEVVVDTAVCQTGNEKVECPCGHYIWNAKQVKHKK